MSKRGGGITGEMRAWISPNARIQKPAWEPEARRLLAGAADEIDRLRHELAAEWDHDDDCPFGAEELADDLKDSDCTCGLPEALGTKS